MKKVPDKLPPKFPKEVKTGGGMDYTDDALAFPKTKSKKKRKGWKR